MTARSTRQKIKDQGKYISVEITRIQGHLKNIDDFANGGSCYITTNIPCLVALTDEIQNVFERFRKGL